MSNITLKQLSFSNMFSYGASNTISLDKNRITQLTAVNGCLAGNSVIIASNGAAYTIAEIVDNKLTLDVLGVDENNNSCVATVTNWFKHEPKLIYRVQFDNGNLLFITDNHLLKTINGWKPLKELKVNDWVVDSRDREYTPTYNNYSDEWWELLTYLITEGGLSNYANKITFSNQDEDIKIKFVKKLKAINSRLSVYSDDSTDLAILFDRDSALKQSFIDSLIVPEIRGYATQKCFPASIFSLPDELLNKILAIYLETDGSIDQRNIISFSTSSIKLGHQLLHLLRYRYKLQCSSRIRKTTHCDNMEIYITRLDYCKVLASKVLPYIVGYKKEKVERLLAKNSTSASYTQDLVPIKYIKSLRSKDTINNPHLSADSKKAYQSFSISKHGITRANYNILLDSGYITSLSNNATSRHLRIKAITPMYEQPVYDIETTTGNFIAGDTLVHNSGKSSIALILQELLFSKNVKGIKKGDILNRYSTDKSWSGSLDFSVDGTDYVISVTRTGASTKVVLKQNGVDISEHKVVDTYKKLQDILGLEFDIFSPITYQSSTDLLDFLKATDTNRKKFLINLFNLEKYLVIGESIKLKASEVDRDAVKLQGELKSIEDFLNSTTIPEYMQYKTEIEADSTLAVQLATVEQSLSSINETCKRIDRNNLYIAERNKLDFDMSMPEPASFNYMNEYQTLKLDLTATQNEIARLKKEIASVKVNDTCPACGQIIDNSHAIKIQQELSDKITVLTAQYESALVKAKAWSEELTNCQQAAKAYKVNQEAIQRFEQLTQVIDSSIPVTYPDYASLTEQKHKLTAEISTQNKLIREINEHNKRVSAHNAKVDALKEQKSEFLIRQEALKSDILVKSTQSRALGVLKKAFSPSGIVAFKLENLTKELEATINYYLSVLSDGQFQIEFSLDKEKLNINVINNGASAPIETMSGGEFSRIQTSILLAIRNLLSTLGGSKINLLFLDEITGVLDDEGKEKLIEVLQKENDLNVFLISHDFTHPLIDKVSIIKENNISSIQN